jgi:3-deoxy-manno-octulosonate cytidylyltransferase (CMP-KDO synthetase)
LQVAGKRRRIFVKIAALMTAPANPIVIIPARLAATRLPDKPLADIAGTPLIVRIWRCAVVADVGRVVVACGDAGIKAAIEAAGGEAVMTDPDLPSGSDRVAAAAETLDPEGAHDVVVNLQGDVPEIDSATLRAVLTPLAHPEYQMSTVATLMDPSLRDDPNSVKVVLALADGAAVGRALYFSRATVPSGDGPLYHHFGLYAFRRAALRQFVSLPPGSLETRERLEQLRAMEAGIPIGVALIDRPLREVNTPEDLERERSLLADSPD